MACSASDSSAWAQQPANPAATTSAGWNLRWRRSPRVTPQPVHLPEQDVFDRPARQAPPQNQSRLSPHESGVPRASQQNASGVVQVGYQQPQPAVISTSPRLAESRQANSVAAVATPAYTAPAYTAPAPHAPAVRTTAGAQPINAFEHAVTSRSIRQTGHNEPVLNAPVGNYRRGTEVARPNDFFDNPFAGNSAAANAQTNQPAPPAARPTRVALAPVAQNADDPSGGFALPGGNEAGPVETLLPPNGLRDAAAGQADGFGLPSGSDEPTGGAEPNLPAPAQGSQMRDLLNDPSETIQPGQLNAPSENAAEAPQSPPQMDITPPNSGNEAIGQENATDSPSDQGELDKGGLDKFLYENPFNENRQDEPDAQPGQMAPSSQPQQTFTPGDTAMIRANELSCEDFRERISRETIDRISLDPSPPFRPGLFDINDYEKQREKFERRQVSRSWTGRDGSVVATGKFRELAYEQVVLETESGEIQSVPISSLSEAELGYISENWGLPKQCLIEQVAFAPRQWTPLTMTWKASNICSKPRYFEEVNVERYGHTAGPWLQPAVSSAHFFVNIAVAPYKMGVHPPNECQYALGYYRPGNCAPWIVPPVPISARGALTQAAVMTGWFWLVP